MLRKFEVSNYKNFKEPVTLNFADKGRYQFNEDCLHDGLIAKLLIYGKNGTGKTNLGTGLMNISDRIIGNSSSNDWELNAETDSKTMHFGYEFIFGNENVIYEYVLDDQSHIISEELKLNSHSVFNVLNGQIIHNHLELIDISTLNITEYEKGAFDLDGRIPFLRWVRVNSSISQKNIINQMAQFIKGMNYLKISDYISRYPSENLKKAKRITKLDVDELQSFLSQMGFTCNLILKEDLDGDKKIYFDYKTPVPFYENASSGVKALTEIFWQLSSHLDQSKLLFLDEYDAFFHYEMSENLLKYFKLRYPDVQIIFTTHNTDLMSSELVRPDCIQILSESHQLTPLFKATPRILREGHNLEKMYRSGEFSDYE